MERFTHDTRSTSLLSNLVGTSTGGSPLAPSMYVLASQYKAPPNPFLKPLGPPTPTRSSNALGKRKADEAEEDSRAGSWTVFASELENGNAWVGKWAGDRLDQLAKKDRSWHDFASRMAEAWATGRMTPTKGGNGSLKLEIDHRAANSVVLELDAVPTQHALVIGASIAHALASLHQGRMHASMPPTPHSQSIGSSIPKSNYSPSSNSDWDIASQATTVFSQVPENATTEQFRNAILKRDAKIKKLKAENSELRKQVQKEKSHKRELLVTDRQRDSQASARFTGGKTLGRTGFAPRDTSGRGGFGADSDTDDDDDTASEKGGAANAAPSSSPTDSVAAVKKGKK